MSIRLRPVCFSRKPAGTILPLYCLRRSSTLSARALRSLLIGMGRVSLTWAPCGLAPGVTGAEDAPQEVVHGLGRAARVHVLADPGEVGLQAHPGVPEEGVEPPGPVPAEPGGQGLDVRAEAVQEADQGEVGLLL